MSTRSRIGILNEDGSIELIYCHSDGYFSHNGRILHESYTTEAKVRELLALSDISVLRPEIGEKHEFDWIMNDPAFKTGEWGVDWDKVKADPRYNWVRAYRRDRGETIEDAKHFESIDAVAAAGYFEEYLYLWDTRRGCWIACDTPWKAEASELEWHLLSDIAAADYTILESGVTDADFSDLEDVPPSVPIIPLIAECEVSDVIAQVCPAPSSNPYEHLGRF